MSSAGWFLTERQRVILGLLARGYDVRRMAGELGYSCGFLYAELRAIRETLGVGTDAGAARADGGRGGGDEAAANGAGGDDGGIYGVTNC